MQRYFLTTPFDQNDESWIEGEDAKHISRVMRMSTGDAIIAVSDTEAYISSILEITPEGVRVRRDPDSLLPDREMPVAVTIACGLPKGDKLDYIVQKGTELGMKALLPFEAERSIVKWDAKKGGKKVERLQKIAKEAAEQCHRTVIPEVKVPVSFRNLLAEASRYDILLVADEEDAKSNEPNRIADRLKNVYHKQSVLVVFGPEGGISRKEAEMLKSAGFLSVSLGPRILRTETAPLYVLSAMSYEFE
ncbi:16S rRNA (uracil(1498)-N(3))-methyltransferase [Sporosarcina sp. Te-1]|uniref:16S rRNA (uracil(1498)-N(3))-methyltransferase n=1 Tax=Sporosarcina sp. Te-1 TaxID=2818390 RepID=UPI001A9E5F5C|nr:16S rRNA (uracil(1498)-N(3))-methyltransferase [Sporosarcina sp. Te-1]QTD41655.1 16S rRNA (uracil(1498)-N(3))-methyltransferase [Sporosarcina sp. Te-1]